EDSELGALSAIDPAAGDESKIIWRDDPATDPKHNAAPNTFKTFLMRSSDDPAAHDAAVEAAFATADFIVEGEYRTGAQEQLYIENNGVIAEAFRAPNSGPDGPLESLCVSGSMQCPYYLVHALELVFNLPAEKCRVIQTETGGAFGGKEDFPSVIGSHAALLALKSGHPVKICYDRAEDLIGTTKRHPSRTRHRTAVSRDRNFLATGMHTATGQHLSDPVDMQHLLTRALRESNYHAKRAEFDRSNPTSTIKRGIGFAAFMHGSGFTGSGERRLDSLVQIDITAEGGPRILVSSTEFGQGTNTILSQVCAQALRIPYEEVLVAQPDTAVVPNSGPTVASRTAMIVGKLVERASESLLATLAPYLAAPDAPLLSSRSEASG